MTPSKPSKETMIPNPTVIPGQMMIPDQTTLSGPTMIPTTDYQ